MHLQASGHLQLGDELPARWQLRAVATSHAAERAAPAWSSDEAGSLATVVHLYRLLLKRTADRAGLRHHLERLAAGGGVAALVGFMMQSAEARRLWHGLAAEQIAVAVWQTDQVAPKLVRRYREIRRPADFRRRRDTRLFQAGWQAAGSLEAFVAELVQSDRVRRVPILPGLFGGGVDASDAEVYPGWAYQLWIAEIERQLAGRVAALLPPLLRHGPLIELVMELGDVSAPGEQLARAVSLTIDSLCRQPYPHWRLMLDGDLPPGLRLPDDARIGRRPDDRRVDHRAGREQPRWRGWLRPGDTLQQMALTLFAHAIRCRPDAVVIHCDEDSRAPNGRRSDPILKTCWDPDAAAQLDVAGALALYRTDRLHDGVAGAHARLLAATADLRGVRVSHVPAILFHRARWPSEARIDTRTRALGDGPRNVGEARPASSPRVSIVIATRDRAVLLERCVRSIRETTTAQGIEIVLVDNGSTEPAAVALLARLGLQPGIIRLCRPGAFNWSALNNAGVAAASGEIVVLMNNDVACIGTGWLPAMVEACLADGVGVVGALLRYFSGAVQHAGIVVGPGPQAAHAATNGPADRARRQNFTAVTGACMAFRRRVFMELGGLDAVSLPITWNDIDFCLRVRGAGYRVVLARDAVLMHDELGTRTPDEAAENLGQLARTRATIAARHRRALRSDPFLNPNLSVESGGQRLDLHASERLWRILRVGGI